MANKNRTEVSGAIQALAAVVGETEHKESLDDNFAKSVVFRKDVSDTDTANAATKTLDFLDIDYIEVAQNAATVAYTLNNVQQGEIKFLKITKTAAQAVTFAVGTDVSIRKNFITSTTVVIYKVTNKDGSLYIESINIDNGIALEIKKIPIGSWDMDTLSSVLVTHGVDKDKIRTMDVMIWADNGDGPLPIDSYVSQLNGGISGEVTGDIIIARASGGTFDAATYSVTPTIDGVVTRGYLTIGYEL